MTTATPAIEAPANSKYRFVQITQRVEDWAVVVVVLAMALLPTFHVLVRKINGSGIPSAQVLVQHLTLWVGMLGALLCTREQKHLSLSTSELLHGKVQVAAQLFRGIVAAVVTALLAYASTELVKANMSSPNTIVGSLPEWASQAVMPAVLYVMAVRTSIHASPKWAGRIVALACCAPFLIYPILEWKAPGTAAAIMAKVDALPADSLKWPLGIAILLALLAGAPIYTGMSGLAMLLFFAEQTPIASVPTQTMDLVLSPTLPAIPLLTAAGYVLAEGGSAKRVIKAYRSLFGWLPGGLAVMTCLICAVFTTLTGGSGVTILALGGLVYPLLREEQYPEGFSLGLVTASGSLGLLFYPSIPVILYGVVAQIPDLNQLYVAGLVPGVLMLLLVCAYCVYVGRKSPKSKFDGKAGIAALIELKWELILPLVLVVPYVAHIATLMECAALTCTYAIISQVFLTKDIPLKELPATLARAASLVGAVIIVLGVALGLTNYLVDAEVPASVVTWVRAHIHTEVGFLLTLNLMLLVLGSVLEIYSAILILAPLVAPLGASYGVDKIHLAIVFLANLELGFLFPPVGLNLFLSASRFNKPLPQLYRNAAPFLAIMAAAVLLITYCEPMTTGVLKHFYPGYGAAIP